MKSETSDKASADARYQAKLTARETRSVEVVVTPPAPPPPDATDPGSIEARYQAKLSKHGKTAPAPEVTIEAKPEAKPEPTAAPAETESVIAAPPEPEASYKPGQSRHQRR
jgi:hypothetical protein